MVAPKISEDALNLLCGDLLGSGIHRKVWTCRVRPDLVVKVEDESSDWRYFANAREMKFWSEHRDYQPVAKWLAPCEYMSPDGYVLLQAKVDPLPSGYELPVKMPAFLTDFKNENFGLLKGQLVCVDYSSTIDNPSLRLKKVEW